MTQPLLPLQYVLLHGTEHRRPQACTPRHTVFTFSHCEAAFKIRGSRRLKMLLTCQHVCRRNCEMFPDKRVTQTDQETTPMPLLLSLSVFTPSG